jgi:hypothetical protein
MKADTYIEFQKIEQRLDTIAAAMQFVGPAYIAARDAIDVELRNEIAALVAKDAATQEGIEAAFKKAEEARAALVVPAAAAT